MRTASILAKSRFREQARALHPDLNGGDHSQISKFTALVKHRNRNSKTGLSFKPGSFYVDVGHRVLAREEWWNVVQKSQPGVFICTRMKKGQEGLVQTEVTEKVRRREIEDSLCGPQFRFRMVYYK